MKLAIWLEKKWKNTSWITILLAPASVIYLLATISLKLLYKTQNSKKKDIKVPVIVVGNITIGGTGKTPLVIWLANAFKKKNHKPGIISRGYGRNNHELQHVTTESDPMLVGDEPLLIAKKTQCPVVVNPNRTQAAIELLKCNPQIDLIISDDGLQHYKLARDFEIAVVDSEKKFGNGWLIPAGPLRERETRLKTVDAIVSSGGITKRDNVPSFIMKVDVQMIRNIVNANRTVNKDEWHNKTIHAVAGIAHPDRFFNLLKKMNISFILHQFPDHHIYQSDDFEFGDNEPIIMTEKDAVKCHGFAKNNWWELVTQLDVDDSLLNLLLERLIEE